MITETVDLSQVPGALDIELRRELPNGGVVIFEQAPAGWLMANSEVRRKPHRAYYYQKSERCEECDGGRIPSVKRPGGTIQCPVCKGTGVGRRERYPSVTTILDLILSKPGLAPWSEARGIEGAVEAMRRGEIDFNTDPAEAVEIVRRLALGADRARDAAAERGLNVHALLEEFMTTGNAPRAADHPVTQHGYIHGLNAWLLDRDPQPEAVEQLVCHRERRYAGRRDLVARVDGRRVGYDLKTQTNASIYASSHLQCVMYEDAGVAGGDESCDELRILAIGEDGAYREMACEATADTVERAVRYAELMQPIDSLCASLNRREDVWA